MTPPASSARSTSAPLPTERPTRRLKIAVDAQCLQTARTGVRTYVDELLKRFTAPGQPHQIIVLRGPRRLPSTVRLFRVLNQGVYLWWLHAWLPLRLWLGRYDILFSPEYLTPTRCPATRVVTFHDTLFLQRPQDYNQLWLRLFHTITLPAIRRAGAVITPSRHAAEEVARLAGIASERIVAVPLGGPTPSPPPAPSDAAEVLGRFGVAPGRYVLHVGVLERRKNLGTLVRAFARWRAPADGGPAGDSAPADFKLVLVGQPGPRPDLDDSRALRRVIAELGLESSVVLTGHVSSAERDAFYAHAAVVAIPSTFEGFGLPILEAFAARAPVVAARATALPEVAGDAALLFDPERPDELATCLARLTRDDALRAALVVRGTARVAQFTWDRTAAETLRVFERAAEGTHHRP